MEGSRKRATDGKVGGHSKDKKSRNQHELNKADMAGAETTKAFSRLDNINVRAPADRETCDVTGLLALADGRLLVSDRKNHNIKLFDVDHKLVYHVQLQSIPYDIAEIDGGQVAVCLPNYKIQLVSVSGILTLGRIIETAVSCLSVTRCGDNLAAVDRISRDIVEIDMAGRKVRTVWTCPDDNLQYIIHNTRGELITTGWWRGAVTCVTRDGVVLGRYQPDNLKLPLGLAVHPDGSIYVCNVPGNIHHITADCTRSIEVFGHSRNWPRYICYNQHDNSLYVSQSSNDRLKVVRLGY